MSQGKGKSNDESLWRDVSPVVLQLNITHTLIAGVRSDLLVIAGTDSTNNAVIALYTYSKKNDKEGRWTKQSHLVTGPDAITAAMVVSLLGNRIVSP